MLLLSFSPFLPQNMPASVHFKHTANILPRLSTSYDCFNSTFVLE